MVSPPSSTPAFSPQALRSSEDVPNKNAIIGISVAAAFVGVAIAALAVFALKRRRNHEAVRVTDDDVESAAERDVTEFMPSLIANSREPLVRHQDGTIPAAEERV